MFVFKRGSLLLALALALLMAFGAVAENIPVYAQEETFEAAFTVVENPSKAVAATLKLNYDHNVFEVLENDTAKNDGAFLLDLNGIPVGTACSIPFRVRSGAAEGEYTLSMDVVEAGDINENYVTDMRLNVITVRVGQAAQAKEKKRKTNQYFNDGKLYIAYDYNDQGYLAWVTTYNRFGKMIESWTALEFDEAGNAIRYKIVRPGSTGNYYEVPYEASYDERGNQIGYSYTYRDGTFGGRYEITYDQDNHKVTTYSYNRHGEVSSITTDYVYNDSDQVVSYTSRNADGSEKSHYEAEWSGSVRVHSKTTAPDGSLISEYTMDPIYGDTLIWHHQDEDGYTDSVITYGQDGYEEDYQYHYTSGTYSDYHALEQYDTLGRNVKRTYLDEFGREEGTTYTEYGDNGKYTETYYSTYNTHTVYEYDEFGREVMTRYYSDDGSYDYIQYSEYDDLGRRIVAKEYDLNGNLNNYTEYEYDEQDRIIRSTTYNANGSKSYESLNTYDASGKSTNVFISYYSDGSYSVSEDDENGNTAKRTSYNAAGEMESYTLYERNEKGRATKEWEYNSKNELTSYSVYQYNEYGDYTDWVVYDADGGVKHRYAYEYDSMGRRTKYTSYGSNDVISYVTEYRYDADGTQHQKTDFYRDGVLNREGEWD